jgi:glycosyltransferase involved in cell wall biosynthesis
MTEVVEKTGGGLLVEKADPGVLAEAIIRLLEDTGLRERLGAEGRGRVPGLYGWDSVAATAEVLYAEATAARRVKG